MGQQLTDPTQVRSSLIVLNFNGQDVIAPCLDSLVLPGQPGRDHRRRQCLDRRQHRVAQAPARHNLIELPHNTFIFGLNEGLASRSRRVRRLLEQRHRRRTGLRGALRRPLR